MSFLTNLFNTGAAAGGEIGAVDAVTGAGATAGQSLTGFQKFMNVAQFAMNPELQQTFMFGQLSGQGPDTGSWMDNLQEFMTSIQMPQ